MALSLRAITPAVPESPNCNKLLTTSSLRLSFRVRLTRRLRLFNLKFARPGARAGGPTVSFKFRLGGFWASTS
jgi:hypothetical protein